MGADEEVSENAPWSTCLLPAAASRIILKSSSRDSPDGFICGPVHCNACVDEEFVNKRLAPPRKRKQFGEDSAVDDHLTLSESCIESSLGGRIERVILVPKRDEHVCINRRCHFCGASCPRSSWIFRSTALRPDAMPGFPMPLYFANGLFVLTGLTRTVSPSPSKMRLSPALTPSACRTSLGTVICPLLVIFACLCIFSYLLFPYHSTCFLTIGLLPQLTHSVLQVSTVDRIVRNQAQSLYVFGFRLRVVTLIKENVPQAVVGNIVVRVQPKRLPALRFSQGILVLSIIGHSQIAVNNGYTRVKAKRCYVLSFGFRIHLAMEKDIPQIHKRSGVGRVESDRLPELGLCLIVLLLRSKYHPQIVVR